MFKNKVIELGEKLLPAFNTPTGIPRGVINLGRWVSAPALTSSCPPSLIKDVITLACINQCSCSCRGRGWLKNVSGHASRQQTGNMQILIIPSSNPKWSYTAEFQFSLTVVTQTSFAHGNELSNVSLKLESRHEIQICNLHSNNILHEFAEMLCWRKRKVVWTNRPTVSVYWWRSSCRLSLTMRTTFG